MWSETEGMFFGQPRVEPLVDGQLLLAVLMVSDSPAARILDLQDFWKGLRTLAHSWSHCVGRPFVQPPPCALQHTRRRRCEDAAQRENIVCKFHQQAELMSASHAL